MTDQSTYVQKENIKQNEKIIRRFILNIEPFIGICLDTLSVIISATITGIYVKYFGIPAVKFSNYIFAMAVFLPSALVISKLKGVYDFKVYTSSAKELPKIAESLGVADLIAISIITLTTKNINIIHLMIVLWPVSVVVAFILRVVGNLSISWQRSKGVALRNVLIMGSGKVGNDIAKKLKNNPYLGYYPVGFVDGNPMPLNGQERELKILGDETELGKLIKMYEINHIIVSFMPSNHELPLKSLRAYSNYGVTFSIVPRLFESLTEFDRINMIQSIPLINIKQVNHTRLMFFTKRIIDIIGSFIAIIIFLPLMLAIGLIIKLDSKGPVFFKQKRCGRSGKYFNMLKFRSMVADAHLMKKNMQRENQATGLIFKIKYDSRITKVGSILRKYSLDELPQFFNVLKGDMSLVGPRPPLPGEVKNYNDWHMNRLSIKPGITGVWQIEGRSDLSFEEMVNLDVKYIKNWTLWFDVVLLLRTIPAVISKRGAY